jgi:hypothetical protein
LAYEAGFQDAVGHFVRPQPRLQLVPVGAVDKVYNLAAHQVGRVRETEHDHDRRISLQDGQV